MSKRKVKGTPAVPAKYHKHPIIKNISRRDIARTKNGDAIFFSGLPLTLAELALLYLEDDINTIPAGSDPDDVGLYWKKMPYDIGASNGVVTPYLLIKSDSEQVHPRPISRHELTHTFKVKNP